MKRVGLGCLGFLSCFLFLFVSGYSCPKILSLRADPEKRCIKGDTKLIADVEWYGYESSGETYWEVTDPETDIIVQRTDSPVKESVMVGTYPSDIAGHYHGFFRATCSKGSEQAATSFTLYKVKEIEEIRFTGANFHRVINYNTDFAGGDDAAEYDFPEWEPDGTKNPICYERNSTLSMKAKFEVEPSDLGATDVDFKITSGSSVDNFTVSVEGGENDYKFTTTNIKTYDGVKNDTLDLNFEYCSNSFTVDNQVFVIWGSPTQRFVPIRMRHFESVIRSLK